MMLKKKGGRAFPSLLLTLFLSLFLLSGCILLDIIEEELDFYSVSGVVADEEDQGIEGVRIDFSGVFESTETDSQGQWSKTRLQGTVTVTPHKEGYAFQPSEETVDRESDAVDFLALNDEEDNGDDEEEEEDTIEAGQREQYTTDEGHDIFMRSAPALEFPAGSGDTWIEEAENPFWIAEEQVTYALWFEVKSWAEANGYVFANPGREGSRGPKDNEFEDGTLPSGRKYEPVTRINWYDAIVWCNALSQYMDLKPLYTMMGSVVKNAQELTEADAHVDVEVRSGNGFRLPLTEEWELASRYKGSDSSHGAIEHPEGSGQFWTPGRYASGATDDHNNEEATMAAAWYRDNSDIDGAGNKTQPVGQKPENGNSLGLYDMSGNVDEWCFSRSRADERSRLGGHFRSMSRTIGVGYYYGSFPSRIENFIGFRLAQDY